MLSPINSMKLSSSNETCGWNWMSSRWQPWKIDAKVVTPATAAARNSRSRSSALNFGSTLRCDACVLTIGTSSSTTSRPGMLVARSSPPS